MKKFDVAMVTISSEEYDQLQKCKCIVEAIWRKFGPYSWPAEFRLPKGKTFADIINDAEEMRFYQIRSGIEHLMDFDDSE